MSSFYIHTVISKCGGKYYRPNSVSMWFQNQNLLYHFPHDQFVCLGCRAVNFIIRLLKHSAVWFLLRHTEPVFSVWCLVFGVCSNNCPFVELLLLLVQLVNLLTFLAYYVLILTTFCVFEVNSFICWMFNLLHLCRFCNLPGGSWIDKEIRRQPYYHYY